MATGRIETRSVQSVLRSIEVQVSRLLVTCQRVQQHQLPAQIPSLLHAAAHSLAQAVTALSSAARDIAAEAAMEGWTALLEKGCNDADAAVSFLQMATGACVKSLPAGPMSLHKAAAAVLDATRTILVASDQREVYSIVEMAHALGSRLDVVAGAATERALLVSFKGYTDALVGLCQMAGKRDLIDEERGQDLADSVATLTTTLPALSSSMQVYVQSPSDQSFLDVAEVKVIINNAISGIIRATAQLQDQRPDYMQRIEQDAGQQAEQSISPRDFEMAERQLAPQMREKSASELDKYIDSIIRDSTAVALSCSDEAQAKIAALCEEVLSLRQQFHDHLHILHSAPHDPQAKKQFDSIAEELGRRLKWLDAVVGEGVVDQVSEVLTTRTGQPTNQVTAATGPAPAHVNQPSHQAALFYPENVIDITPHIEEFNGYAARLCQVAKQVASRWRSAKTAKLLLSTVHDTEQLAPVIVEKALEMHGSSGDQTLRQTIRLELDDLRESWTMKVQLISTIIDDLTHSKKLVSTAESLVREGISQFRNGLRDNDTSAVNAGADAVVGPARRLIEYARKHLHGTSDRQLQNYVTTATAKVEEAIRGFISAVKYAELNPQDRQLEQQVALHARTVLQGVRDISTVLTTGAVPVNSESSGVPQRAPPTGPPAAQDSRRTKVMAGAKREPQQSPLVPSASKPVASPRLTTAKASTPSHARRTQSQHPVKRPTPPVAVRASSSLTHSASRKPREQTQRVRFSDGAAHGEESFGQELLHSTRLHRIASTNRVYRQPIHRHVNWVDYLDKTQRDKSTIGQVGTILAAVALKQDPDVDEVKGMCRSVQEHTDRLVKLAKLSIDCFANDDNLDEIRLMRTSMTQLAKISPQLQSVALAVCDEGGIALSSPIQTPNVNQLQVDSKVWAQHVQVISTTIDDFIVPWAATAMKLAKNALDEKGSVEAKTPEMRRLTDQLQAMAAAALEAGELDEASLGDASSVQEQRDAAQCHKLLRSMSDTIVTCSSELIRAAKQAGQAGTVLSAEHLHLVCREWGVQASRLASIVDSVTVSATQHVPALTSAVRRRQGVDECLDELGEFSRSLQDTAAGVIAGGCGKSEDIERLRKSSSSIKSLNLSLQITAQGAMKESPRLETGEPNDSHLISMELLEVKAREWNAKVHLLSVLVDEMTSDLGIPLDRLAGAALAVSKGTIAEERVQRIKALRFQEEDIKQRASRIQKSIQQLASTSKDRLHGHEASCRAKQMVQTVPRLVKAAHSLADQPDRHATQQFQHARRCWVANAAHLVTLLSSLADADAQLARGTKDDILGVGDLSEEEVEALSGDHLDFDDFGDDILSPIAGARHHGSRSSDVFSPPRMDHVTSTPHHGPRSKQHLLPNIDEDASTEFPEQQESTSSFESTSTWLDDQADQPPTSRSIIIAARSLHDEASKFDADNNSLAKMAKKMSQQMYQMAQFTRHRGPIQSKSEMIDMARKIASDSGAVVRYAQHMAEQTTDWRIRAELLDCAEVIPTFSTQLSILASVKSAASSPRDNSADAMLVKNAQNLMQTVMRAMRASQAACMKGLQEPMETDDTMTEETREMALLWKRQLKQRRSLEKDIAPIGSRGLRRFGRNPDMSSLAELSLTG